MAYRRKDQLHIIWEITQATLAILVTGGVIYTTIQNIGNQVLTNAFFLVIGTYFVRTTLQSINGK